MDMFEERGYGLTRRDFLGAAAVGVGAVGLSACGSTATNTAASTASTAKPSRGGTFRLGPSGSSSSDSVDPLTGELDYFSGALDIALYDTLTRKDPTSPTSSVNWLAEEFEPAPDLSYYTVRLRDAEFQNGKPVTADDVIFTLKRLINPKNASSLAGFLEAVDPNRLQKLDSKTVRINLHFPDVSVPGSLAENGGSIVPVGYDPKKPIGSGPFKLESFDPGVRAVLTRNDNYWVPGRPYLDAVEIIAFADTSTPRVDALLAGEIDGADHLDLNLVPTVDGNPNIQVEINPPYGFQTWEMRMDVAPFDDVRVCQAMRLIADRPQIVEQAFSGSRFARVGNDLTSPQDPLYDNSIPQRQQDIDQAKSLLKQAGREGLTVELVVANGVAPGITETAQVLQQNAKAAGVTININVVDATTYYDKYYAQAPFKFDFYDTGTVWDDMGFALLPTALYNISNWRDPQWLALVTRARGTLDFAKQKQLMAEAQEILWNTGTMGIFAYNSSVAAYNKKFARMPPDVWAWGLNHFYFDTIYQA